MKINPIAPISLCLILPLFAQEQVEPARQVAESVSMIPFPISDGTPPAPREKVEPPEFYVLNTLSRDVYVNRSPLMPGTPRVEGMIRVTMNMAADPGLPDPPEPLPALPPDDPRVIAAMEEFRDNYKGTKLLFLSATVHDHSRTLLTVYPNGRTEGTVKAVSNLDFNHFSGFSTFRVTAKDDTYQDYGMLMGVGNVDTEVFAKLAERLGHEYEAPDFPELVDSRLGGPDFVVLEGEEGQAMDTLRRLHELYRTEGRRMEEAYYARLRATAKRKAELIANPPKPEDVTITFWKRTPKRSELQSEEAGQ
jgi:hypothetical protein